MQVWDWRQFASSVASEKKRKSSKRKDNAGPLLQETMTPSDDPALWPAAGNLLQLIKDCPKLRRLDITQVSCKTWNSSSLKQIALVASDVSRKFCFVYRSPSQWKRKHLISDYFPVRWAGLTVSPEH